jgi:hypothetical protein
MTKKYWIFKSVILFATNLCLKKRKMMNKKRMTQISKHVLNHLKSII